MVRLRSGSIDIPQSNELGVPGSCTETSMVLELQKVHVRSEKTLPSTGLRGF